MARREAARKGLTNILFEANDVSQIEEVESYDLITAFDAIDHHAKPAEALSRIAVALKPNGVFLTQDIATSSKLEANLHHPIGALLYTVFRTTAVLRRSNLKVTTWIRSPNG